MSRTLTAEQIASAFNRHQSVVHATEQEQCCGRGKHIVIWNQGVQLRRMMEDLGFSENEIVQYMHSRKELPVVENPPVVEAPKKKGHAPYAQHSADECDDPTCSHY
jgi:hypothetical protein